MARALQRTTRQVQAWPGFSQGSIAHRLTHFEYEVSMKALHRCPWIETTPKNPQANDDPECRSSFCVST